MSQVGENCCAPCDPVVTLVPGTAGAAGAAGSNGLNAYTVLTASLLMPGVAGPVIAPVSVGFSGWAGIGQVVFISDGTDWGHFEVLTIPGSTSFTLEWLQYPGDSAGASTINSGASVSPSGVQATFTNPLPVANGGTGSATKAAAQAALGLGSNITQDFDDALAYAITNSYATITGITVAVPATGLYKVEACVTVSYTGVTFAANRLLSVRARNTTAVVTVSDKTVDTGIHTTLTFPAIDYVLPIKTATLTAADVIELQIQLDTVESAGSAVVTDAFLVLTPLALA